MSTRIDSSQKLRYEDYVQIPSDGCRHEIIGGEHHVNPAPSTLHQRVSKRLQYELYTKIELAGLGVLYDAPVDVQLTEFDIVQPDLVIVLNANVGKITPTKIKVAPDLLVEIISPTTAIVDRTLKKDLYQRAGVREYWIVDPFEQQIEQYVLCDGSYQLQPFNSPVELVVTPGIAIDPALIW